MNRISSEEQRIVDVWRRLACAWSDADPVAAAALWEEDCDYKQLGARRNPGHFGRAGLERALADAFARRARRGDRTLECPLSAVRFIRDDVAIVDGMLQVTAPGSTRIALCQPVTAVMIKHGGDWLIAASRASAPFTPSRKMALVTEYA